MIDLRQLTPFMNPERLPARHCETPGCVKTTRLGKPFCTKHVLEHPYARDVQRVWESGATVVVDLVTDLSVNGPRTIERLAREVDVSVDEILRLVKKLKKLGRVKYAGKTKRGSTLVRLVA